MKHKVTLTRPNYMKGSDTISQVIHFDTVIEVTRVEMYSNDELIQTDNPPFLLAKIDKEVNLTEWLAVMFDGWTVGEIESRETDGGYGWDN